MNFLFMGFNILTRMSIKISTHCVVKMKRADPKDWFCGEMHLSNDHQYIIQYNTFMYTLMFKKQMFPSLHAA